jgi:hypothetical protein
LNDLIEVGDGLVLNIKHESLLYAVCNSVHLLFLKVLQLKLRVEICVENGVVVHVSISIKDDVRVEDLADLI